ncbi:PAS domain S-box-containing protein [Chitinophaga costaii]|uniref:histidine kinase n=1 Tax=Chitinophaga costaii TaxID=1335309 RepID=A0A1C4CD52_9BACT|nr:PAS domain-containing protein [Chitinophaga costaii]SCC17025.1 PAS domain S-box-containing protein [Chitinophaga costaii]
MNIAMMKQILDVIRDPVAVYDKNCCLLDMNAAFGAEILKYQGIALRKGDNLKALGNKIPLFGHQPPDWHRALLGESFQFVNAVRLPGQAPAHFEISFKPLLSESGEVEAAFFICRNISNELNYYNDLRRSDFQLQSIQQAINSCALVLMLDTTWHIVSAYAHACNVLQQPEPLLRGRSFADLIAPPHIPDWQALGGSLAAGQTWRSELAIILQDKRSIWIDATFTPMVDERQLITGYVVIGFDVTERKLKEIQLRENERFFRDVLEKLPIGLQEFSPQGLSIDMNKMQRQIWGNDHPVMTQPGYNLLSDPYYQRNGLCDLFLEVLNRKEAVKKELLLKYKEELQGNITRVSPAYYEATVFPILSAANEVTFLFLILDEITDKKLAKIAVEKNQRLLDNIIENLPMGYIQFDNFGFIQRVNQTQRTFFNSPIVENSVEQYNILSDPFSRLFQLDNLFMEVLQKNKMIRVEKKLDFSREQKWTNVRREVYIDMTIFPVEDPVDKDLIVVALMNDVTEKKRQESENTKSQELLLQTGEIGKIGGWELDVRKKHLRWSDETYKIHEIPLYPPITFTRLQAFYAEESQALLRGMVKAIIQGKKPNDVQLTLRTARNNTKRVRAIGRPVYENNKLVRIYGVVQDITEQYQMRGQLTRNQEMMRLFFDSIDMGYAAIEDDGRVTYLNRKAQQIIGRSVRTDSNIFELLPWMVNTTFHARLNESINRRASQSFNSYFQRVDRWYDFLIAPMREGGVSVFFRDITDSKKMSKELRKANEQLNSLNKNLLKQNKQLEEFAHITSHNLRAPIANLKALMQMHNEALAQQEKELYLGMLHEVIKKIDETLNDLVEVVQIRKDVNVEREWLNFADRVQHLREILYMDIETSGMQLTTDFEEAPGIEYPKVYLDSIIQNMITNAIRYRSPERPPKLHLQARREDDFVVLTAEDNGVGIDMDRFGSKLFGFRKTFHKNKDAKGIGLFITKSQVEAMGGSIRAESTLGAGTKFIITFKAE